MNKASREYAIDCPVEHDELEAVVEIFKLFYNLKHGWTVLMFMNPHLFH